MPVTALRPTKLAFRAAMEAGDLAAVVDTFATDAIVHSPLTARTTFHGHEQIRTTMEVVLEVFDDLTYTDELHQDDSAVLIASARVAGTKIEMVDHMRFDTSGKIRELTVFFRPLPAIAIAMRLIGSGLARRESRTKGRIVSMLTRPLGLMTDAGDRMGVRVLRPTAQPRANSPVDENH